MRSRILIMTAPAVVVLGLGLPGPAFAQTSEVAAFQQGVQAFDAGDYKKAADIWEPLAESGNVEALRNLAQLHRLGLGVQQSDARAFELYEQAAERGLAAAQVNAAFLLLTGKGVEQDRKQAAVWFGKAADQGNALAQYNLGLMYEKGIGVEKSEDLALELYQAAAAQGQKRAIARLEALEAETETRTADASEAVSSGDETAGQSDTAQTSSESEVTQKRPRPSMDEIGEAVKTASEMASSEAGSQNAQRQRPAKEEIAEAIRQATAAARKAAGEDAAGLTRQPASKPLEFETLEDGSAPKEAYVIKFDAQGEGQAPREAYVVRYDAKSSDGGDAPREAYVVHFDADGTAGEDAPSEAYVIRFDASKGDAETEAPREAYVVKYDASAAETEKEAPQEAYVVRYDAKADTGSGVPEAAYVMKYDAGAAGKSNGGSDTAKTTVPKNPDLSITSATARQTIETVPYTSEASNGSGLSDTGLSVSAAPRAKPEQETATEPMLETAAIDEKTVEQPAASVQPRAAAPSPTTQSGRVAQVKQAEQAYKNGDYRRAAALLEPLAIDGLPIAQFWLGRLYNRGEGVPLNRSTAYILWRLAASGGSDRAATALANLSVRLSPEEIAFAEQRLAAMR